MLNAVLTNQVSHVVMALASHLMIIVGMVNVQVVLLLIHKQIVQQVVASLNQLIQMVAEKLSLARLLQIAAFHLILSMIVQMNAD